MQDYQLIEKIYESPNSLVYRGFLKENEQPIILKILKENYPTPSEMARYQQEYEIIRSLNTESIVQAYDLQRYDNTLVILLEDFGGRSLKLLLSQNRLNLESFLSIAIKITEGLAAIHQYNIIHKDINPSNIVYNPQTQQLKIIDFGISTRLSQEFLTACHPHQLEGTLAYIAPEQTGRMNRGLDYRSDFYSLGVTFYELLTHQLPFNSTDPMELVHYHIAQQPLPIQELISEIPLTISHIINKLLAKMPEERYQSAAGIRNDLETCLHQLKTLGRIDQFPLGKQDITGKFHIPRKIYGREEEITQLLTAFERVSQGITEMMIISGYSGIGKSVLVNEIYKPVTCKRGQLIKGKFDQLQKDTPYSAISQAFQALIRQLLSEPENILQIWKKKILEALGKNGQIIIDVIPDVEKIIGKQKPVELLGQSETQNRFNLLFKQFINVFAKKEHPLVMFIDDLQWADLPSLNLIEQLISDGDIKYFLIIGAYRDNEVSSIHPLVNTLDKIQKSQVPVSTITLYPLEIDTTTQLISDILSCSTEVTKPLAELMMQKTGGNPFFLTQLLYSLYQDGFIRFNLSLTKWQWNIQQIESVSITDNVVDLMTQKIKKLDQETQKILKLASCIGNQFSLEALSIVNNTSLQITAQQLELAINSGLVIPLDNNYKIALFWNSQDPLRKSSETYEQYLKHISYRFLHDRVQQAVYSLMSKNDKEWIHLQIGRLFLKNTTKHELSNNIFEIVNQLNEGSKLITGQHEKDHLAELNLKAGKKAKASTAYETALKYLDSGLSLLRLNSWTEQYQLTLELHEEKLHSLFLNTEFQQILNNSEIIISEARSILDKIRSYQIQIEFFYANFQPNKAINTAINVLKELGIIISRKTGTTNIHQSINESLNLILQKRKIEDIANLPIMTDPYKLKAIQILQQIMSSTATTDPVLHIEIILKQIDLFINYGNSPESAATYSYYGMILCGSINNYDLGYEFGKLALQLLAKYNIRQVHSLIIQTHYGCIYHWKKYLRNQKIYSELLNSFQIGLDVGDNQFASYVAIDYCLYKLLGGYYLEEVEQDYIKYSQSIKKLKQTFSCFYQEVAHNIVFNLQKQSNENNYLFLGDSLKEEKAILNKLNQTNNEWLLFLIYFAKLLLFYNLKIYTSAVTYAEQGFQYISNPSVNSFLISPQHNFYSSLSFLASYPNSDRSQKKERLKQVENNQQRMKRWMSHCPDNFKHKYDLVEAEKARVLGNNWEAQEFYEKAIQGAKKYEFIHEEALAYERAAEFYFALAREEIGKLYLRNAYHCYIRWGAKAKVKQLEEEYPQYLLGITNQTKSKGLSTTISTTGNDGEVLDLTTILKASQAISGEIKLENLLQNLMKIVIENAGAQKGYLILEHQEKWVIEAQGTIDQETVNILQSISIELTNPDTSIPILPTKIIYYVARTQETIVLNDATAEGEFITDPYIIAKQTKSILCTPLLHQGQLKGIIYLENNLTTGAFTDERVELLNILAAQAAISIDNSRLYQTLEQRVEERTTELRQTVEVLKATQAELIFENDLLKSAKTSSNFVYQVGGSLPMDAPTYVVRKADKTLYKALKQSQFCYVLNARQMGKSSLMVRMMNHFQHEGIKCAVIDLTRLGTDDITPEQWYKGLAVDLLRSFGLLRQLKTFKAWWNEQLDISPVQRLGQFIEEFLLPDSTVDEPQTHQSTIIFIDEIDSVLALNFDVSDFFALIRSFYNQRAIQPDSKFQSLTFAFFGAATPSALITDTSKTPFNIGQGIELESFKEHEAQPLLYGLNEKLNNPQTMLKQVLSWTGGQPFLTQKVCQLMRECEIPIPPNQEKQWLTQLIQEKIIQDWETHDQPEHLKTIQDRILKSQNRTQLLTLYQEVLENGEMLIPEDPHIPELCLSGLVIKRNGKLKVHNRIYQIIFDYDWIERSCQ